MPKRDGNSQGPGRGRLLTFRMLAAILLILSLVALGAIGLGAYLNFAAHNPSGRVAAVTASILGVVLGLLVVISMRAFRVRSLAELEIQSRSPALEKLQRRRDPPGQPYP